VRENVNWLTMCSRLDTRLQTR